MSDLKRKAALAALCCSLVGGFEGVRYVAYKDPVGIPTACFGETKNIRLGQRFTRAQCDGMLTQSLIEHDDAMLKCVKAELPDDRHAALLSFAYNVGAGTFCKSSVAKKLNAGDTKGACDALLLYVYARGVKLPGLVNRRNAERDLCMKGMT